MVIIRDIDVISGTAILFQDEETGIYAKVYLRDQGRRVIYDSFNELNDDSLKIINYLQKLIVDYYDNPCKVFCVNDYYTLNVEEARKYAKQLCSKMFAKDVEKGEQQHDYTVEIKSIDGSKTYKETLYITEWSEETL